VYTCNRDAHRNKHMERLHDGVEGSPSQQSKLREIGYVGCQGERNEGEDPSWFPSRQGEGTEGRKGKVPAAFPGAHLGWGALCGGVHLVSLQVWALLIFALCCFLGWLVKVESQVNTQGYSSQPFLLYGY